MEIADPLPLLDWRAVTEIVDRTMRSLEEERALERERSRARARVR